jgi:hypothetical protein
MFTPSSTPSTCVTAAERISILPDEAHGCCAHATRLHHARVVHVLVCSGRRLLHLL